MKELIACLATVVLISLSLSGCSSTNDAPARGEGQSDNSTTAITPEDRDNVLQTMKDMRIMATACEAYAIDNGHYPEARSAGALAKLVSPVYVKTLGLSDAWGNEFEAESSKEGYEIRSLGRDGKRDDYPPAGMTGDLDADIVFSDIRFTQAPFED